jgi:V/A-type H+-transporting ATPase subunit I
MAIVKMKKLSVIGLDAVREQLTRELMDLGVVEMNTQDAKLADAQWTQLVTKDGNEGEVSRLEGELAKVALAIDTLKKYDTGKKPLFVTRKAVKAGEFAKVMEQREAMEQKVAQVLSLHTKLAELKSAENKVLTSALSLKPWMGYALPLQLRHTKSASVMMGVVPAICQLDQMRLSLNEVTERYHLEVISSDTEQHYLSVICMMEEQEAVLDVLKTYGFNQVFFKDMEGTAAENIQRFNQQMKELEDRKKEVEGQIAQETGHKEELQYLYDSLVMERDREKIRSRLLTTKRTFYLDGWLPAQMEQKVIALLEKNECWYEVQEPEKDEPTPVALQNNSLMQPFEVITELYSLPASNGVDATNFISIFYFIFFGMMLSDAGYGLVLTIACGILLKKFRLEGMMKKLVNMFFYCGISTVFWGAMFGSWFGNIVSVSASTLLGIEASIKPLWFDPVADPMKLLIVSIILGVIHLFLGMGIKAYMLIKEGKAFDAFCDIFLWYLLIIGLVLFGVGGSIAPIATTIGQWMSIAGALGILVTGGRDKKGIGKITGGLGSLYGITSYLSDALSYSRLLALGLATGVIAQVINTMAGLLGGSGGIIGTILFVVVCIVGHVFNLAINTLGSFVHSSRLQYVEFFGKFFEGGGVAFDPFRKKTKYVDIIGEDK